MRRVLVGLLTLVVLFVFTSTGRATGFGEKTPGNAALRSLICPGWGQFFNEQPLKGMGFISGEIALAASAFVFYAQSNEVYDDYAAGNATWEDYESKYNMYLYLTIAVGVVWGWNVLDAYLSAPALSLSVNDKEIRVTYEKKF